MNWQVKIADTARKNLKRFPTKDQNRIKSALDELVFNPYSGDIEKMEDGEIFWRRRIGAYRIFFDIDKENKTINVTHIKRRTTSTY
jgi:mRNA-degrading endonuclease RelE of RelBE toxin-antitoxin system